MWIIIHRKIFYALSVVLIGASVASVWMWGMKLGIDFEGGSLIEMTYSAPETVTFVPPTVENVRSALASMELGETSVRETDNGFLLRTRTLTEKERETVTAALLAVSKYGTVARIDSVGPLLGKEAIYKSFLSIGLVLLAIVAFIAFAFRKVSKPVASWKYGVIAVIALFHDVFIPTGVFAYLGHFAGVEIDTLFVTALLVVLGFSVHDTIVVFDRVRENLHVDSLSGGKTPFETIVGNSVAQTFARSINTSFTTFLSLIALYFVGPEATRLFSLALIIGIVAGTYSSIFIASPLLVTVHLLKNRNVSK